MIVTLQDITRIRHVMCVECSARSLGIVCAHCMVVIFLICLVLFAHSGFAFHHRPVLIQLPRAPK